MKSNGKKCPSCRQSYAQVENLDMKEINFNQSKKDLTEARIHHLLSESMVKHAKRTKKLTYRCSSSKNQVHFDQV